MDKIEKPKTHQGKRALAKKEPKIIENTKVTMLIRAAQASQMVQQVLKDLYLLKKPDAVMYQRKNPIQPFEDETPLEFFSQRGDCSLFAFGSHNKKRPNNLILGRMFNHGLLDMFEFGVDKFVSLQDIKSEKVSMGNKPGLLFAGLEFDSDPTYQRLKNLLIDWFRGPVVSRLRLQGVEHVISFTVIEGRVFMRSFRVQLKKSGERTPHVQLQPMGPDLDLTVRRSRLAADDLYKRACRVPKTVKPKKKKNVSYDAFGTRLGRVHVGQQNIDKLQTRKLKALKKRKGENETQVGGKKRRTDLADANESAVHE